MQKLSLLASLFLLITNAPAVLANNKTPSVSPSLSLSPTDAVRGALRKNLGLKYERLAPELSEANERAAGAFTDAVIFGEIGVSGAGDRLAAPKLRIPTLLDVSANGSVGIKKTLVSGTALEARLDGSVVWDSDGSTSETEILGSATLSVRHPLLLGSDRVVNRAGITRARLSRTAAELRLRRKAELVAADTLKAYWDLHAALANGRVQRVALAQAEKNLAQTRQLIAAGKLAASEEVMANHLVQTQRRAVLLARQAVSNGQDDLARRIGLVTSRSLATPAITTVATPTLSAPTASLAKLQKLALERRGDYQALKTDSGLRRVEVRVARHKLLPRLDLVGTVSVNGKRGRLSGPDLAADLDPTSTGRVSWAVGVVFELPLGNREARANRDLADLKAHRAEVAIDQRSQAISLELKVAWRAVQAARDLVKLSHEALGVAELKLANEQQRYQNGRTTAQLLVLVHSEVVRERLAQHQAQATLHKGLVDVWTATGSLLQRLGSSAR